MHFHNTKKKQKISSSSLSHFVKVPTDTLLIVESPAKCSTIEKHLGPGYRCIATMGHMRHLDGLDSVDIKNNYKLNFTIMESKKSQIRKIQAEIKMSAKVVIATDDDREGESIAWHICDMFHLPIDKTERIIFHEITKDALEHAVKHPKRVNMSIVYSAHARQILDLLIGYKISPLLWNHIASDGVTLSAGRCQTPALRIIYENELERLDTIERLEKLNRVNENSSFYSVIGFFTKFNLPFSLTASFETQNKNKIDCFLKASTHENAQFIFKRVSQKPSAHVTKAPEPFTTSRLQQVASNEFAFSPSETMEICQTLYERGYITYIRTTGKSYSADFINGHIVPFIREKWGSEYAKLELPGCIENDTTSAHEAIRPTDIMRFGLTGDYHAREQKMYKLIWRNTVESCMSDYTFSSLEIAVETNILMQEREQERIKESNNEIPEFYAFLHTCHKPIFYGWKVVQGLTIEQREQEQHGVMEYLLHVKNLSEVSCNKIETKVVFSSSKLLSHYTEARLIQSLEEKEIGRPSTFSTIIEKIKERNYVKKQNIQGESIECVEHVVSFPEKKISQIVVQREFGTEKNKLCITSLGKSVCSFLVAHFPRIFSYEYTKQMEADLDDIAWPTLESSPDPLEILKRVCDACCREIRENIHKYNSEHKEKKEDIEKLFIKNEDDAIGKNNIPLLNAKCGECVIGTYGGFEIVLKNGRFGKYVVWGKDGIHRKSIEKTHLQNKEFSSISLDEIVRFIENDLDNVVVATASSGSEGILRIINDDVSIRSGKYGNYIFYKTVHMKKPKFISLKDFQKNIYTCFETDIMSLL
jgi:DNA topoisomerase-1